MSEPGGRGGATGADRGGWTVCPAAPGTPASSTGAVALRCRPISDDRRWDVSSRATRTARAGERWPTTSRASDLDAYARETSALGSFALGTFACGVAGTAAFGPTTRDPGPATASWSGVDGRARSRRACGAGSVTGWRPDIHRRAEVDAEVMLDAPTMPSDQEPPLAASVLEVLCVTAGREALRDRPGNPPPWCAAPCSGAAPGRAAPVAVGAPSTRAAPGTVVAPGARAARVGPSRRDRSTDERRAAGAAVPPPPAGADMVIPGRTTRPALAPVVTRTAAVARRTAKASTATGKPLYRRTADDRARDDAAAASC